MTDLERFYWRRWRACAVANQWTMRRGRLVCDQAANRGRSDIHGLVWRQADALALESHCAVSDRLLRHACHCLAAGVCFSHSRMKPAWFDQLLALWGKPPFLAGLLIEPDCVSSMDAWLNPARGRRRRQEYRLRTSAPQEYVDRIRRDQHIQATSADLTFASDDQVGRLTVTLSERSNHFSTPISRPEPETLDRFEHPLPVEGDPF